MYIGKLNGKFINTSVEIYKLGGLVSPSIQSNGNILRGEELVVDWKVLLDGGAELRLSWDKGYHVNDVVVTLGSACTPNEIRAYSPDGRRFLCKHTAETGNQIKEREIVLPVESELDGLIIEMDLDFSSVVIKAIDVYGADFAGIKLFPEPISVESVGEDISVSRFVSYTAKSDIAKSAAKILCEKWQERFGVSLVSDTMGGVDLVLNQDIPDNGYRLEVSGEEAIIEASDLRGMVYGVESLLKLEREGKIPVCKINDAPRMPFRAVHLMIPAVSEFEFTKRLVKYLLSPMGYNSIILYIGGAMQFDSHPKINEAMEKAVEMGNRGEWPAFPHCELGGGKTVPKKYVRDFIEYCRGFGIHVIPEVQSLGHVQFMTEAYPEIAERYEDDRVQETLDTRVADALTDSFYAHCYCPSNEKSYKILFDLIDEVIDVFSPCPYMHMGHDEVYQIGICKNCKHRDPAELYAEDVNRIHAYLAERGIRMMIWSDMIQPVTSYKYKTPPAIKMIPKDIICLDFIWYFHLDKDIEDNLLPEGYKVVYGNMYSSHFPRYESRIAKENIVGAQISAWTKTAEHEMAREGKIYDFTYSAEMMWSDKYTSHARFSYDRLIRDMMPELRQQLGNRKYPSMTASSTQRVILDNGEYISGVSKTGAFAAVGAKYDSIIIEHAATEKIMRYPWVENDIIGEYQVRYEDESEETIPVTYAGILTHIKRRQGEPFGHKYYRHNGYTATYFTDAIEKRLDDGNFESIFRYEWINPRAEVGIKEIEYVSNNKFATDVYVARIVGVKK